MKVTPVNAGPGTGSQNYAGLSLNTQNSRLESAKSIAQGNGSLKLTPSETPVDPMVAKAQDSIRKIKMKVNRSPDKIDIPQEIEATPPQDTTASVNPTTNEQGTIEETKPLSPQYAELAKLRRSLQVKERELQAREQAIQNQAPTDGQGDLAAKLKSETLKVLQEQGLLTPEFYNSLTEYLTNGQQAGLSPEQVQKIIDQKMQEHQKRVDEKFVANEAQAEEAALTEMLYEAENLAKEGESYDLIRRKDAYDRVLRHIYTTYKDTGRVMDVPEAMNIVESQLEKEAMTYLESPKLKPKLAPREPNPQLQPQMRTLTNKDTAQPAAMDRRTRAILAAMGQFKR